MKGDDVMLAFFENKHIDIVVYESTNMSFPPHLHKEFEFVLCIEGEISVTSGSCTKALKRNDFFLSLPNTIHSYATFSESKVIMCIFSYDLLPMFKSLYTKELKEPFVTGNQRIARYCEELVQEFQGENSKAILVGYLQLILGNALKQLCTIDKKTQLDKDVLPEILQYIEQNYRHNLSLTDISKKLGYNPSYLSKLFSERVGCTLSRYINEFRINYAKHLLADEELSITYIAYECGFSSQRTFNRVFIQLSKTTPRAFRASLK